MDIYDINKHRKTYKLGSRKVSEKGHIMVDKQCECMATVFSLHANSMKSCERHVLPHKYTYTNKFMAKCVDSTDTNA